MYLSVTVILRKTALRATPHFVSRKTLPRGFLLVSVKDDRTHLSDGVETHIPGSQGSAALRSSVFSNVRWQQELCGSLKLNKQVNKIPGLSVTQECAEVDRRELRCVARVVICVADVSDPAGFRLKHKSPAEGARHMTLCLDYHGQLSIPLSWTLGGGACCHVTLGSDEQTAWAPVIESAVTAPAVTASDELLRGHE